ncbi:RluA family pseudouridine synthase, partial [Escherichia coli]|nr:RluA family pseudouridine synthase [Escherichia coli]
MHKFIAQSSDNGRKLIKYISSLFKKLPEGRIYRLFRQKSIKVNNKRIADSNYVVKTGDEIIIYGIKDEPSFVIYD